MAGPRILLVDGEPDIQELLADELRGHGYAVDLAARVAEALAFLSGQMYDVVITEWKLPDGDGRLIADWAAELGAKTFVMSGYLSYMPGGRALGHETVMKPIRLDELIAAVKRSVGEANPD